MGTAKHGRANGKKMWELGKGRTILQKMNKKTSRLKHFHPWFQSRALELLGKFVHGYFPATRCKFHVYCICNAGMKRNIETFNMRKYSEKAGCGRYIISGNHLTKISRGSLPSV